MSYVQGFLIPVPKGKKAAYRKMAKASAPIFEEYGALHIVECWGNDLPKGKSTDFMRAVKAKEDENVVFSWIVWPSKKVYKAAAKKMESDPRWEGMGEMPFDGKRLMWGGFDVLLDTGGSN